MSNENKKKVSIWKVRLKGENHPWVFLYAEDDQSFTAALHELNRRFNSQANTIIYRSKMPREAKDELRALMSKARKLVDNAELGSFEFIRVYGGTADDRIEGMTAYKASMRMTLEETQRWLYDNDFCLIKSHVAELEKHSDGMLFMLARCSHLIDLM